MANTDSSRCVETSYEDMIEILEHYQSYVPSLMFERSSTRQALCYHTAWWGARARGAQLIRANSELQEHSLDGILPVAEDWHAKVCLVEV